MSKFNLGDKVYYIEKDWYLENVVSHYGNEYGANYFGKSYQPFEIISVKHVKAKGIWDKEITESVVYDLCYMDNNNVDIRENIDENDIFLSFEECCTQAIVVAKNTRWR